MAAEELNSFVYKFKNLWRNGQEATLNVRSKAGNAWVELSVGLGHPVDLPPPPLHKDIHHGNSRDRRRNRRAAEKLNEELKETEEVSRNKTEFEKEHAAEVDKSLSDTENLLKTVKGDDNLIENFANEEEESNAAEEPADDQNFNEPCESCKQVFAYNKDLNYKMCDECLISIAEKEMIDLPNRYQCEICRLKFKTKTLFKRHERCFNFGSNSLAFICEVCDRIWKDEEQFENHMKQKHIKHKCVRCNKKVEGKDNLDEHFRAKHRAF